MADTRSIRLTTAQWRDLVGLLQAEAAAMRACIDRYVPQSKGAKQLRTRLRMAEKVIQQAQQGGHQKEGTDDDVL